MTNLLMQLNLKSCARLVHTRVLLIMTYELINFKNYYTLTD